MLYCADGYYVRLCCMILLEVYSVSGIECYSLCFRIGGKVMTLIFIIYLFYTCELLYEEWEKQCDFAYFVACSFVISMILNEIASFTCDGYFFASNRLLQGDNAVVCSYAQRSYACSTAIG